MLSRIFWAGLAAIALLAGMAWQDGPAIISWADDHGGVSASAEHAIEAGVDRAVEGSLDKMQVVGPDGKEIAVPAETKRALGEAVGRLVKAETSLAMLRARDGSAEELRDAEERRAQARAEVDRLQSEIKRKNQAAHSESEVISQQVRDQIREEIRTEIREAVRN